MFAKLWKSKADRCKEALDPGLRERLARWEQLGQSRLDCNMSETRWVVVDVESSGLDVQSDSLIAIGAVAVRGDAIAHEDSFEVVLRQEQISSEANILIHGIAGNEQRAGREPAAALMDFLEFVGSDPLIAYHAFFDQAMLGRACKQHLGVDIGRAWLDLAYLTPAVLRPGPQDARRGLGLDDWLARFGITVSERHRAVADAYATAQLWQCLAPSMTAMGMALSRDALKLAADYEWLRRTEPRA